MGTCCDAFDKHWILFSSMWHLPWLSQLHTQGRPKCALGWLQKLTHVPLAIAILLVTGLLHKVILVQFYWAHLIVKIVMTLQCRDMSKNLDFVGFLGELYGEWYKLICGIGAIFYQGYTMLKGAEFTKIRILPLITLFQTPDCCSPTNSATVEVVDMTTWSTWLTLCMPLNHCFKRVCPHFAKCLWRLCFQHVAARHCSCVTKCRIGNAHRATV